MSTRKRITAVIVLQSKPLPPEVILYIINILHKKGASVNTPGSKDCDMSPALEFTATYDHISILNLLLSIRTDITSAFEHSELILALKYATSGKHKAVAQISSDLLRCLICCHCEDI